MQQLTAIKKNQVESIEDVYVYATDDGIFVAYKNDWIKLVIDPVRSTKRQAYFETSKLNNILVFTVTLGIALSTQISKRDVDSTFENGASVWKNISNTFEQFSRKSLFCDHHDLISWWKKLNHVGWLELVEYISLS